MAKVFDALIIGGGPAGLSTALALGRVHRTCAVFTSDVYRNDGASEIHALLTRDHTKPEEIRRLGRKDIEKYNNTDFFNATITTIKRTEAGPRSYFTVSDDATNKEWKGRTIVLATGVRDQFPDLPGYAENWPHSIFQCPLCDGHERATQPFGVLTYPDFSAMHAKMATIALFISQPPGTTVDDITGPTGVTLFTNGPLNPTSDPSHAHALDVCKAHHITVDQRRITHLETCTDPRNPGLYINLDPSTSSSESSAPTRIHQSFLLHKPPTTPSSPSLISQLALELTQTQFGTHIKATAPFNSTNVPGVFVAGDAGVMVTHLTTAMASSNAAVAGVLFYVSGLDDEVALERLRKQEKEKEGVVTAKEGEGEAVGVVNGETTGVGAVESVVS